MVNIFQVAFIMVFKQNLLFLFINRKLVLHILHNKCGDRTFNKFSSFPHRYKYMLLPHFSLINIVSFSLCFNFKDNLFIVLRYKCYRNFVFKSCETLLMVIVQLIILHAHTMTKRKPDHKHFF